jgi:X-X-X-Leu-X-X-Gly heptad repeat protein
VNLHWEVALRLIGLRLFVLLPLCYMAARSSASEDSLTLRGFGSGQVVSPNTCTPKPLIVRLDPPEAASTIPVRFSVISVPKGARGCQILRGPADTEGSAKTLDQLSSASGEAVVWVRVGDTEGAYIITAEHPLAANIVTFFVHARRRIWQYLIPVPILLGLGLVVWGVRVRRQWAVGSGQLAVGSGQLAVGSGRWAVGSWQGHKR